MNKNTKNALHPRGSSPPPGGHLQKAATVSAGAVWLIYKSYLAGPVAHVVPSDTRDALFQLFCDIRANVPKDRRFLERHVKAFKPKTALGWVALAGTLGYGLSAVLILSTLTLGISVAGVSMGLLVVLATGVVLASALGFLAFVLFTSAFVVGALAFTALSGYVIGSGSLAVMKYINELVFGRNNDLNETTSGWSAPLRGKDEGIDDDSSFEGPWSIQNNAKAIENPTLQKHEENGAQSQYDNDTTGLVGGENKNDMIDRIDSPSKTLRTPDISNSSVPAFSTSQTIPFTNNNKSSPRQQRLASDSPTPWPTPPDPPSLSPPSLSPPSLAPSTSPASHQSHIVNNTNITEGCPFNESQQSNYSFNSIMQEWKRKEQTATN